MFSSISMDIIQKGISFLSELEEMVLSTFKGKQNTLERITRYIGENQMSSLEEEKLEEYAKYRKAKRLEFLYEFDWTIGE